MSELIKDVVIYTGPMSAGKTNALYQEMGRLRALGVKLAAFQPTMDVRGPGLILPKSYAANGASPKNCTRIASPLDITQEQIGDATVVAFDELNFFGFTPDRQPIPGYYRRVIEHLAHLGVKGVRASALNVAANKQVFPMVVDAMGEGADIQILTASCMVPVNGDKAPKCGEAARNTQIFSITQGLPYHPDTLPMLLPEGERPDLGYRPVCVDHLAAAASLDFRVDYPELDQTVLQAA